MSDVDSNYKALKKNIKDFSKVQNTDKKKRWICHDSMSPKYFLLGQVIKKLFWIPWWFSKID